MEENHEIRSVKANPGMTRYPRISCQIVMSSQEEEEEDTFLSVGEIFYMCSMIHDLLFNNVTVRSARGCSFQTEHHAQGPITSGLNTHASLQTLTQVCPLFAYSVVTNDNREYSQVK